MIYVWLKVLVKNVCFYGNCECWRYCLCSLTYFVPPILWPFIIFSTRKISQNNKSEDGRHINIFWMQGLLMFWKHEKPERELFHISLQSKGCQFSHWGLPMLCGPSPYKAIQIDSIHHKLTITQTFNGEQLHIFLHYDAYNTILAKP